KLGGRAHTQLKFDGIRVQLHLDRKQAAGHQGRLFSRSPQDMTCMFPELGDGVLRPGHAETAILASQALGLHPAAEEFLPFQETTRRRRKLGIEEAATELPLKAMVFDVMYRDGQPLLDRPLLERMDVLSGLVRGKEVLLPETGTVIDDPRRLDEIFE